MISDLLRVSLFLCAVFIAFVTGFAYAKGTDGWLIWATFMVYVPVAFFILDEGEL